MVLTHYVKRNEVTTQKQLQLKQQQHLSRVAEAKKEEEEFDATGKGENTANKKEICVRLICQYFVK